MAGLIPQSFLDDLLARADIVAVIGSRVHLKKMGANWMGRCPFHEEKTPSFSVSPAKQIYHCFGCGKGGNVLSFLMEFERLSFAEAVAGLANQLGMTIPETTAKSSYTSRFKELYAANEAVQERFVHALRNATVAIDYLQKRGFTGKICRDFGIGYAATWKSLEPLYRGNYALKKALLEVGVLIENHGRTYSRFGTRITFPIRNQRGQLIGFGGRTVSGEGAKYLNSPESLIFHKGEELYGLFEALKAGKHPYLMVVEGYLDVVSLAQFGFAHAVATLGTAITARQVQCLLKYTTQVIFCFDGDEAGRKAAVRALGNILPYLRDGVEAKFLFLPEGEDPDSLIRKIGLSDFEIFVRDQTVALSDFLLNYLDGQVSLSSFAGKARFVKLAAELLRNMPHGIYYRLLVESIADKVKLPVGEIERAMEDVSSKVGDEGIVKCRENSVFLVPSLRRLLTILLNFPQFIATSAEMPMLLEKSLPIAGIEMLNELISLVSRFPELTTGSILEHFRGKPQERLWHKLAEEEILLTEEALAKEVAGICNSLSKMGKELEVAALLKAANMRTLTDGERRKLQNLIASLKQ